VTVAEDRQSRGNKYNNRTESNTHNGKSRDFACLTAFVIANHFVWNAC